MIDYKGVSIVLSIGAILAIFALVSCKHFSPNETLEASLGTGEENKYFDTSLLISEKNYDYSMKTVVIPYLDQYRYDGVLQTRRNSAIYYELFIPPESPERPESRGTIVIFEGFCEFTLKYDELCYYFLNEGYNVLRFDHKGQGNSSRDYYYDMSRVYIKDFSIYVEDAMDIIDRVLRPKIGDSPLYLYAHSMGGCIGALFLEDYPNVFKRAILNAPMLTVKTGTPQWLARIWSYIFVSTGFNNGIVPGHKQFTGVLDFDSDKSFDGQTPRSISGERVKYQFNLRKENINYQTSAATYGWLNAALKATNKALNPHNMERVTTPTLIFQSQYDSKVLPQGQNRFIQAISPSTPQTILVYYNSAEHEIFNSKNPLLITYYERIFKFLEGDPYTNK